MLCIISIQCSDKSRFVSVLRCSWMAPVWSLGVVHKTFKSSHYHWGFTQYNTFVWTKLDLMMWGDFKNVSANYSYYCVCSFFFCNVIVMRRELFINGIFADMIKSIQKKRQERGIYYLALSFTFASHFSLQLKIERMKLILFFIISLFLGCHDY